MLILEHFEHLQNVSKYKPTDAEFMLISQMYEFYSSYHYFVYFESYVILKVKFVTFAHTRTNLTFKIEIAYKILRKMI